MDTKSVLMHIDGANEITVATEAALAARPRSAPGLVCMLASGAPATGTSFGAGRARDASVFGLVREVVDIASVFPLRHAAIVMSAAVPVADAVRIADEKRADVVLDAKVNHLSCGLVPQIAHAPLNPLAHLVPGTLELLPAPGVPGTAALLLGKPPELLAPLPLEGADAAPGDDERLARRSRHGSQVDLPEVNGCLHGAGSLLRRHDLDADMQLEAPVPDERTRSSVVGKRQRQDEGRVTLAHRQDDASFLAVDGLGGPLDRVERFGAPGIFHTHLGMLPAQSASGFNRAEEGVNGLLHRLSIEGELTFSSLLQLMAPRPLRMAETRLFVQFHAEVPHSGRLHLRRFEAVEERRRETGQVIDAIYFHIHVFFLSTRNAVMAAWEAVRAESLSPRPFRGDGRSRSLLCLLR